MDVNPTHPMPHGYLVIPGGDARTIPSSWPQAEEACVRVLVDW